MFQKQREPPKFPCKVETVLDRISSLPGHLIDNFLSHLPVKDAVRTSVLSRKWRYKWATVPSLVFDTQCLAASSLDPALIKNKLVSIVDHVLLLHNGPIQKFKLSHRDLLGAADIDRFFLYQEALSKNSYLKFGKDNGTGCLLVFLSARLWFIWSYLIACSNLHQRLKASRI
ncbi:hypothetical protein SLEP1_g16876 [Rubroshorea leprosula]|uniref:F-box domain-containing protein n=1 Tax=Rubroshorea leprosula TaxID=152421 RepID=A0AAV5J3Y2_9ROSI|nr:hypothetical protein SLEP1_g16876 [Rubroshorea leprosula]